MTAICTECDPKKLAFINAPQFMIASTSYRGNIQGYQPLVFSYILKKWHLFSSAVTKGQRSLSYTDRAVVRQLFFRRHLLQNCWPNWAQILYVNTLGGPLPSLFKSWWFCDSSWFCESLMILRQLFFKRHLLQNRLPNWAQILCVGTLGCSSPSLFKSWRFFMILWIVNDFASFFL